jgi:hypothetical protein
MSRAFWWLLSGSLCSACATPPVREDAYPAQRAALQTPQPCHAPDRLVRDLTVPWEQRIYVVGPCPDTEAKAASANEPAVPESSANEFSQSQRTAP